MESPEAASPASPPPMEAPKKKTWIRANVESFAVAIAMALVIKAFAVEAFQVPTESMEPMIIGRQPGGDHLIVDKSAYYLRDPERYEIVVFRYDLSRPVNYVKRCVGLPGEKLIIAHGDIYAGKGGATPTITRKPSTVLAALFAKNPIIPESHQEGFGYDELRDYWTLPRSGAETTKGKGLALDAGQAELLVTLREEGGRKSPEEIARMDDAGRSLWKLREYGITPYRRDPMAPTRKGMSDSMLDEPTGDVLFEVDVEPESNAGGVLIHLTDGTQVATPLRLHVAVEGGDRPSQLRHGDQDVTPDALKGFKIKAGDRVRISVEHADDRYRLLVDGDTVATYDYEQPPTGSPTGRTTLSFGLSRGRGRFHRLALYRELYYSHYFGAPTTFDIPEGHYLFLGDNSPNSLDARGFRVSAIRLRDSSRVVLGDMEAVSDDLTAPRQASNPYFESVDGKVDDSCHHFLDIQGNHYRLESGSYDILNLNAWDNTSGTEVMSLHGTTLANPTAEQVAHTAVDTAALRALTSPHSAQPFVGASRFAHFTPRKNVLGRAVLAFWPISRWGFVR